MALARVAAAAVTQATARGGAPGRAPSEAEGEEQAFAPGEALASRLALGAAPAQQPEARPVAAVAAREVAEAREVRQAQVEPPLERVQVLVPLLARDVVAQVAGAASEPCWEAQSTAHLA